MNHLQLPKRVFNSPLIACTNFENGTFVNLIRLIKPYAGGINYAIYETTGNKFCSSGLFKKIEKAKEKFEFISKIGSTESPIRNSILIDHSKPYPENKTNVTF